MKNAAIKNLTPHIQTENIHHIFFDLDHTLWDFDRNAEAVLNAIYIDHNLAEIGVNSAKHFVDTFRVHNREIWRRLEAKEITHDYLREERFKYIMRAIGVEMSNELSNAINTQFLDTLSDYTHLIEGTIELLDYLAPNYEMHILSNGFDSIQRKKMQLSGLEKYFKNLITFDTVQARKPDREIFEAAMHLASTKPENSLMVGDSIDADIKGALGVGMTAVWYDADGSKLTPEGVIRATKLSELIEVL
ncbi:MAG: putative hydrolase of the HAD superfamily [Spirosomataceae bacterium]|jgi:putative hydrolase of the HAD superfamily